ncbi:hypothetical protein PM030_17530, partial [Halorubrum ezzemoulense]
MSSPDWAGQRLSRRNLLGACIAAGTATLAGCTSGSLEAETTVTREYDGTDISEINVQGVNGDIAIRDTQRETIQLNGTKRAASEDAVLNARRRQHRIFDIRSSTGSGALAVDSQIGRFDSSRIVRRP